jgi:hypothetical protein
VPHIAYPCIILRKDLQWQVSAQIEDWEWLGEWAQEGRISVEEELA